LLAPNVRIKLPVWSGADEVEAALREIGRGNVMPAQASSTEMILDADVVICNGASSIHAEATLMGRPTICLLDDCFIPSSDVKRRLRSFPDIHYHDYASRQPIPNEFLYRIAADNRQEAAPAFDYSLVERIISAGKSG
jgi:hypothetical protein